MAAGKSLGILLFSTPYTYESTDTAVKIAETALRIGHQVSIFAYGDGVHEFTVGQKPKGIPNAEQNISRLREERLDAQLPGTCLNHRGIADSLLLKRAKTSTLSNLSKLISKSDASTTLAYIAA
jgi:tRNA 2-thiouridine synthesizing protein D